MVINFFINKAIGLKFYLFVKPVSPECPRGSVSAELSKPVESKRRAMCVVLDIVV